MGGGVEAKKILQGGKILSVQGDGVSAGYSTGGGGFKFNPNSDAFYRSPGPGFISNWFYLDTDDADQYNPFNLWRRSYGAGFYETIKQFTYANEVYDDDLFRQVMNSGLCTGFCAVIAWVWDCVRAGTGHRMNNPQTAWSRMLMETVMFQGRVMTAPVISHYKYFVFAAWEETYRYITRECDPQGCSLLLTFAPKFWNDPLGAASKLVHAHTLFVKGWQSAPDGVTLFVWDPNFPEDNARRLFIGANGGYAYATEFEVPVTITSGDGTESDANGCFTRMGNMQAIAVPSSQFRQKADFIGRLQAVFC